ncbi:aprataxin-like protein [Drosophila innubila]|uniref:aprataxin-like protein n=1 Tax=Drosophila innubila TaxID=198719 RepID=UPI00148B4908|nr:aprataxin-like protein [Drosophila innubila]
MSWQTGLIKTILDPKNLIISTDAAVVIADKYPKARHHYLVLPKEDITSIFQLHKKHLPLLEELHLLAHNIIEVRGEKLADFKIGFHAEPSMQRLHLHVISKDFVSSCLKTKKHWNSFNTQLFLSYETIYDKLNSIGSIERLPKDTLKELHATPLTCNQCEFVANNIPTLKQHLEEHYELLHAKHIDIAIYRYWTYNASKSRLRIQTLSITNISSFDYNRVIASAACKLYLIFGDLPDYLLFAMERELARSSLTRELDKKHDFLIETDQAAVIKDSYPKAQYHFLVVAKENIDKVTALTREHLPLLDHMMELANQIIEKQQHLPANHFLVGFKIDAFMNRLSMHVISNDFYSVSMRRKRHWNSFNTDLFLTYQAVYALLRVQGSVEPMSVEKAEELRNIEQLHCNQCEFESNSLVALKGHLFEHWKKRENDIELKKQVEKISKMLDESKLDVAPSKVEGEIKRSENEDQSKPKPLSTNWRQNPDQKQNNVKNAPKEQPISWRQNMNQPPTGQQPTASNQNPFAKHFQKSVDRQNQRQQIVSEMQGQGLIGPYPPYAANQLMFQPNHAQQHQAFYNFQLLPNVTNQCPPFMAQHRPRIPNNNINQVPQSSDSPPRFNPFRQPPNMRQVAPNQYNGANTIQQRINPVNDAIQTKPNWKPKPQCNQGQNKPNYNKNNSTPVKTQPNESLENKPNWKPNSKPNQGQNQSNNNRNNSNLMKTQPNEAKESKPKVQHNQGQNRNVNNQPS